MQHSRRKSQILALLVLLALVFCTGASHLDSAAQSQTTPNYARTGAYALYDMQGGAVAFFTGVQGNISYTVTNVFPNDSMAVRLSVNVTEGDEIPTSYQIFNYTDNVLDPKVFPILSHQMLGAPSIVFQNITMTFVKQVPQTVGAGTFQTLEYQGTSNGTSVNFYFDNSTGLAIYELSGTGSLISLISSNVATPISVTDPTNASLPYVVLFIIIFAACALGYYQITRYYGKQAKRDFKKKWKKERQRALKNKTQ